MARVQIEIPESNPKANVNIPVRITDINYGNHLGNDAMVSIIHESRMQLLKRNGLTELEAGGTALIMGDLAVQFKSEAYYGDILNIEIFVSDISKVSFNLIYRITTKRGLKAVLIALASTTMVSFDYVHKKVCAIPPVLHEILS